jgi:ABC-type Fe3+/spermidine/putrescine transport system ATPase subunit
MIWRPLTSHKIKEALFVASGITIPDKCNKLQIHSRAELAKRRNKCFVAHSSRETNVIDVTDIRTYG